MRQRLHAAVPWARAQIDAMDPRAIAVAIDLVRKVVTADDRSRARPSASVVSDLATDEMHGR